MSPERAIVLIILVVFAIWLIVFLATGDPTFGGH